MASPVASSSVAFPISEPAPRAQPRPTHLPFRRISLPTAPTLMHRQSVVSVASFDSLPEEDRTPITPLLIRRARGRLDEPQKRNLRRREPRRDSAQEAKRRKVIQEFYQTERAYVDGLELIYSHFLTPIIASLDTPQPLLDRAVLTSVFSNFIDIWNLHRSFFSALSMLLFPNPSSSIMTDQPLSPILLSHFPYLSLYTPFVTAFPGTISSIIGLIAPPTANRPNPQYNESFASFISKQEADPRCGKLTLRDWLLTIVQRCPRYLLLLKDLIECTDSEDLEHEQLTAVHTLVSKITLSLNTSLHTHAQTLSLLAIQRATPNLPFQLIVPGRTLLKRGPLMQVERSEPPREREFLLFSDCLVWLASEESERTNWADWGIGRSAWASPPASAAGKSDSSGDEITGLPPNPPRPKMIRTRSKSEAEISLVHTRQAFVENNKSNPSSPVKSKSAIPPPTSRKSYQHPQPNIKRQASSGGEEKWVYKGRAELVDLQVIITPPREAGEERRCEILSPEGSFVLYAESESERDDWCSIIRQAKSQLMVSLVVTNPNSTLTSSESTAHIRRALQALPFPPNDERNGTISQIRIKGKSKKVKERRGRVEHWVPAIWIPDEKATGCMRCGRSFGWRRRRHHCRLCGRCVCAACSDRTFFISDPNNQDKPSPARACTACYETVFPLLDPRDQNDSEPNTETHSNSISSLTNFTSWLSMPSLPLSPTTPDALMSLDSKPPKRSLPPIDDDDDDDDNNDNDELTTYDKRERLRRIRASNISRPRSYIQILEDFQDFGVSDSPNRSQVTFDLNSPVDEDDEDVFANDDAVTITSQSSSKRHTVLDLRPEKNENTAKRNKRFSLPAVALQTTSVTTRTQQGGLETVKKAEASPGRKRFSLVLNGRHHSPKHSPKHSQTHSELQASAIRKGQGHDGDIIEESTVEDLVDRGERGGDLAKGVAAGHLSELLGRKRVKV